MFSKIPKTKYPPQVPTLIWDGACGFCKYWITVWKSKTSDVQYASYQNAASQFPDIPIKEFKKASRFIALDGIIYSGPDSAYMGMAHFEKPRRHWHRWYCDSVIFRWLSDQGYNIVAKNRPLMMRLTVLFWGRDPLQRKPYWMIWIFFLLLIIMVISGFL